MSKGIPKTHRQMKKQCILFVSFLFFTSLIFAQTGIFESYIILNNGTNQYYDAQADTGNPDFEDTNLGSFNYGTTYLLKGEIKTCKNTSNGDNVSAAYIY